MPSMDGVLPLLHQMLQDSQQRTAEHTQAQRALTVQQAAQTEALLALAAAIEHLAKAIERNPKW